MIDLKRIFRRSRHHGQQRLDPDSQYNSSQASSQGLEVEYHSLIATQFRRWNLVASCMSVEVRCVGRSADGFDVFMGMVRLTQWDRVSVLRTLIGWPLLEAKVRKSIRATWLADISHFAGLWLHASEQMQCPGELRELIAQHVPFSSRASHDGEVASGYPPSSIPSDSAASGS